MREDIPEDLGPEETLNRSTALYYSGSQYIEVSSMRLSIGDLLAAAVMRIRRAQWFLMSLPIAY